VHIFSGFPETHLSPTKFKQELTKKFRKNPKIFLIFLMNIPYLPNISFCSIIGLAGWLGWSRSVMTHGFTVLPHTIGDYIHSCFILGC
jgi:hypothetical protein